MSVIFITGGIGCGKTYSAQRLGDMLGLRVVELDAIYFDLASDVHRAKKAASLRDRELAEYLDYDNVIMEGWHFGEWLVPMYMRLSAAIILDVPLAIREARIKERYRRRKSGEERDPFPKGGAAHLENLLQWTKLFDVSKTVGAIRHHAPATCTIVVHSSEIEDLDIGCLSPSGANRAVRRAT